MPHYPLPARDRARYYCNMISLPDSRSSRSLSQPPRTWHPKIFAHRGASGYLPENTVAAVSLALEMQADGIEIDVHRVEDRILVLHDSPQKLVSRWAPARGPSLLAALRSMDVGNGHHIPFLEEVLELLADASAAQLNIEVKDPPLFRDLGCILNDRCPGLIRKRRVLVSSFYLRALAAFHQANPDIPAGCLTAKRPLRSIHLARSMHASSLHLPLDLCSPQLVAEAHQAGIQVLVFTVNTAREVASAAASRVDGLFTDYPDYVRRLCQRSALRRGDPP
ncbi:MAG TPA: glycerophosphodiester phosphodiesterase [Kiritimatiellae bacterium]|nr:glycerophosphodiester phosphodiesterase [Kiritimatiellia bacterium]